MIAADDREIVHPLVCPRVLDVGLEAGPAETDEREVAGHDEARQALEIVGRVQTLQAELGGGLLERHVGIDVLVDAEELAPEPELVDHVRREHVRLRDHDVAPAVVVPGSVVADSAAGQAGQRSPAILVEGVGAVAHEQAVLGREGLVVPEVVRHPVRHPRLAAGEVVARRRVAKVRFRVQLGQRHAGRVAQGVVGRDGLVGEFRAVARHRRRIGIQQPAEPASLAEVAGPLRARRHDDQVALRATDVPGLDAAEEERFVPDDRTAEGAAPLVLPQDGGVRLAIAIAVVATERGTGVEDVVAEELVRAAVKVVRASANGDHDHAPRVTSVFSRVVGRLDLHLLDGIE